MDIHPAQPLSMSLVEQICPLRGFYIAAIFAIIREFVLFFYCYDRARVDKACVAAGTC
jgi:hypothetical protein